jgi:hypothetical protein
MSAMAIKYPKEFVEKAKRLYPNWTHLHELLDKGSPFVHSLLYDSQPSGNISLVRVLNAESLEELQEYARSEQEKAELYLEWTVIYDEYKRKRHSQTLKEIEEAHKRGERLT